MQDAVQRKIINSFRPIQNLTEISAAQMFALRKKTSNLATAMRFKRKVIL